MKFEKYDFPIVICGKLKFGYYKNETKITVTWFAGSLLRFNIGACQ